MKQRQTTIISIKASSWLGMHFSILFHHDKSLFQQIAYFAYVSLTVCSQIELKVTIKINKKQLTEGKQQ